MQHPLIALLSLGVRFTSCIVASLPPVFHCQVQATLTAAVHAFNSDVRSEPYLSDGTDVQAQRLPISYRTSSPEAYEEQLLSRSIWLLLDSDMPKQALIPKGRILCLPDLRWLITVPL